jgi:hypothetical protein
LSRLGKADLSLGRRFGLERNRQQALTIAGDLIHHWTPMINMNRHILAIDALPVAHAEHPLGRAFDKHEGMAAMVMIQRRHIAMLRFERDNTCLPG